MRTVKTYVYLFNELNKDVQKKIIEKTRNSNIIYNLMNFDDLIYDFINQIEKRYKFTIDFDKVAYDLGYNTGVCFTKKFDDTEINNLLELFNIKFEHICILTNRDLKDLFISRTNIYIDYSLNGYRNPNKNSVYANCELYLLDDYLKEYVNINNYLEKKADELEKRIEDLKNQICDELEDILYNAYEYYLSDEYLSEYLDNDLKEYTFDGKEFKF